LKLANVIDGLITYNRALESASMFLFLRSIDTRAADNAGTEDRYPTGNADALSKYKWMKICSAAPVGWLSKALISGIIVRGRIDSFPSF
jgi:hypothetical protein